MSEQNASKSPENGEQGFVAHLFVCVFWALLIVFLAGFVTYLFPKFFRFAWPPLNYLWWYALLYGIFVGSVAAGITGGMVFVKMRSLAWAIPVAFAAGTAIGLGWYASHWYLCKWFYGVLGWN